ncbi:hypothetical protein AB0758_46030 [Tolypothrix bouteillei VB521301_2]|uniref:Uncharacterized protein n=1 Tax=Tolypothrix bouteillei VB521301 TaxID=1479485 RepID=A0A0C1MVW2_9CYAN
MTKKQNYQKLLFIFTEAVEQYYRSTGVTCTPSLRANIRQTNATKLYCAFAKDSHSYREFLKCFEFGAALPSEEVR